MKIQYASDLHLEFGSKKIKFEVSPEADVLVLAGDIHKHPSSVRKFFNRLRRKCGRDIPIIYVLGNHEYWGRTYPHAQLDYSVDLALLPDVELLDNASHIIDGVRFLGCTLFTDLSNPLDALVARESTFDFEEIEQMSPKAWTKAHKHSVRFLERVLDQPHDGPTVVVTHFPPTWDYVKDAFKGERSNVAFAASLRGLILAFQPTAWIFGHTHQPRIDDKIGDTRLVCNQVGYYFENYEFEQTVLEI